MYKQEQCNIYNLQRICYVMLRYVTLRYVTLHYITLYYIIPVWNIANDELQCVKYHTKLPNLHNKTLYEFCVSLKTAIYP